MEKYNRLANESYFEYGMRLIRIKVEENPNDLDWQDIVDKLELNVHRDTLRKSVTGTPFSGYAVMKHFAENEIKSVADFKIAQTQARDERNELNKKYREIARVDKIIKTFKDIIANTVVPLDESKCEIDPEHKIVSDNDMVVMLSDIHYGIMHNSMFNSYSPYVAKKRMDYYLTEVVHYQKLHNSENCYLVLGGDMISGLIHSTLRIENIENVINQIKGVSVLVTSFIEELSKHFNNVFVYETPGNHSRLMPNKDENQKGDLLDTLVTFYAKASLKNYENVHILNNITDDEICEFTVRGYSFVGVHGDKDTQNNVLQNMTRMLGYTPDVILMSHLHHNAMKTVDNSKLIINGSLSGMDNYTINKRISGYPEQLIFTVTKEKKIDCVHNIEF